MLHLLCLSVASYVYLKPNKHNQSTLSVQLTKVDSASSVMTTSVIQGWTCYTKRDEIRHPSVDVDASATSTACCDLDLWSPASNQVIRSSWWIFPVSFIVIPQDICEILGNNIRPNKQMDEHGGRDSPKT